MTENASRRAGTSGRSVAAESGEQGSSPGTDLPPSLGTTAASAAGFGIGRRPALSAIRAKCLDCAATSHAVRLCECANCPLWPFRLGVDPWRKRRILTGDDRERQTARMHVARAARAATLAATPASDR